MVASNRCPIRLLMIGCGPAARHSYLPALARLREDFEIELCGVVDLTDQLPEIASFFEGKPLIPHKFISVDPHHANDRELADTLRNELDQFVISKKVNAALILTEPKAHLPYLKWAIGKQLRILIEKPICAPINATTDPNASGEILETFKNICELLNLHREAQVTVMTQRRYHYGYDFVRTYLADIVKEFEVPIHYIDLFYSDGEWRIQPEEYLERRNHPLHFGYGKLMHGGYHFVDLLSELIQINQLIPTKVADRVSILSQSFRPLDQSFSLSPAELRKLFGDSTGQRQVLMLPSTLTNLGELDSYSLLQFKRGLHAITSAMITLQHSGFSRRAWLTPNLDTYRKNGRVRHERVNINVGPLLGINVNSYEAWESDTFSENTSQRAACEIGGPRHFEVEVFRNSGVIGGEPFEKFNFGQQGGAETRRSLIQESRDRCIYEFISGSDSRSEFHSHYFSNFMLAKLCHSLALVQRGMAQGEEIMLPSFLMDHIRPIELPQQSYELRQG